MISKLPRWAWPGAWALSLAAGAVNVTGLLGFEHQAVTHLTGTASLLAAALSGANWSATLHLAGVIVSFVIGAALSGVIVRDEALKLGRRYGVALLLESLLLCLAVPLLERNAVSGVYLTSCACGLQNAMVSTWSGAVIRTTHLTGVFTDLGALLGHTLVGLRADWRRVRLFLVIISGFVCGGFVGAFAFRAMGYRALLFPAGLLAAAAFAYAMLRRLRRKRAEKFAKS